MCLMIIRVIFNGSYGEVGHLGKHGVLREFFLLSNETTCLNDIHIMSDIRDG